MYIYVQKKKKKKKKTVTCFLWEVYFFWDWTQPLSLSIFPTQTNSEGKKKGGGATSVGSRLTGELVTDPDLSGFSDPRSNGPVKNCCYEFT